MSCPLPCPLPYQLVHLSGSRAPAESLCHQKWNLALNLASSNDDERVFSPRYFSSPFENFCHRVLPLSNTPLGSNLFIKGLSLSSNKDYQDFRMRSIFTRQINTHLSQFSFDNNWVRTGVEEEKKDEHYEVESQEPSKSINTVHYLERYRLGIKKPSNDNLMQ